MIVNVMHDKALPVYGKGENVRDWLYVEDHAEALVLIATKGRPGESYNVGGASERRNIDVVRAIGGVLDARVPNAQIGPRESLIRFVTDRPGHDARYAIDFSKLERELGWKPAETFETGIRKTVRWYLDHQPWVENVLSGSYRDWVAQQYGA